MGEAAAGLQDVCVEEVGAVLDAFLFLHVGTRSSNGAAVDDRVAAGGRHLVNHHDFLVLHAEVVRFKRSAQTGKARADDQKAGRFVPLFGNIGARVRKNRGGRAGDAEAEGASGTEELATRNRSGHVSSLLFGECRRRARSFKSGRLGLSDNAPGGLCPRQAKV